MLKEGSSRSDGSITNVSFEMWLKIDFRRKKKMLESLIDLPR